jgi:hypothetical protein
MIEIKKYGGGRFMVLSGGVHSSSLFFLAWMDNNRVVAAMPVVFDLLNLQKVQIT